MPNKMAHPGRSISAVTLLLLLTLVSASLANSQTVRKGELSARQIAQRTFPSVVVLVAEDRSGDKYLGSGFFVDDDVVATNYHVIKAATKIVARRVGQKRVYQVLILSVDEQRDLALLKLYGPTTEGAALLDRLLAEKGKRQAIARPLTLAKDKRIAVGDIVYVAGNPEGLEGTFSQGIVSALRGRDSVQITAPISHGSSGGPVLNSRGEVIGVAVGTIAEGQNLNFAIPISQLSLLITQSKRESIFDRAIDQAIREKEAGAKPASPETGPEPSLEETISWLKEKLEGSSNYGEGMHVQIDRLSVSVSQFDIPPWPPLCQMDLSLRANFDEGGNPIADVFSIFLRLAERSEAGHDKEGRFGVWLYFRSNISYQQRQGVDIEQKRTDVIRLPTRDEDLAERVSKAFNHVIKLCGGGPKKEPF